jgi:hypothetical protein
MNKGIREIGRSAKECVRQRLVLRPVTSIETILSECGVQSGREAAASRLFVGLGDVIGVEPGRLRPNDRMGELLRVRKEELGPGLSIRAWEKAGLKDFIEVFSYDIMYLVEKLSTRAGWNKKWGEFNPRPRNEEESIDRIMEMTLCEFLLFFSEAMK